MRLSTKVIGGLAWAGLVVVLAVPSADIVSAQLAPKPALTMTSDIDQVQTASIGDPAKAATPALPSFVVPTPAPKPTVKVLPPSGASTPIPVTVPVAPMPTEVAAVPEIVAPVPYPANMRPKAPVVTDPIVTGTVDNTQVAALPEVTQSTVRRPPAAVQPRYVTEDELEDWDSGSLADYLENKGLIADASYDDSSTAEYDRDGFFLDEGPNNNRNFRSRSRRDGDGFFFVPD